MSSLRRYLPLLTIFLAVASFYVYNLDGVGLLGPDEPRYAAIGRAMEQTGDWITPKLWGSPWFEKPPLLYWLTGFATWLGAAPEISARLPVALLSLAFLSIFTWLLIREFGSTVAIIATASLATSIGWIAYSNLCLTDIPLAGFFALSIFLLLPMLRPTPALSPLRFLLSGAALGCAVLAKGLVPLVLILPAFWFLRRFWRYWWLTAVACIVIAVPWYLLVYQHNGFAFIEDFFLKQHFQRFYSPILEHVRPWYFYLPVLPGFLFPWTPLFLRLFTRPFRDRRYRFLLTLTIFGFVFFSASLNKLNGYLLPLMPLLFALLGCTFVGQSPLTIPKRWLVPSAALVALIPLGAAILPDIMSAGRVTAVQITHLSATQIFYIVLPVAAVLIARRSWASTLLVLCVVCSGFVFKIVTLAVLDEKVSARTFWYRKIQPVANSVCEEWIKRDWVYGLSFYRGQLIPPCHPHPKEWHLLPRPRTWPDLVRR